MKHKANHEEHMDESWLIPYADLLTLLLALFIVLFASSAEDQAALTAMRQAFFEEYNGVLPEPVVGEPGMGGIAAGSSMISGEANEDESKAIADGEDPDASSMGMSAEETAENLVKVLQEEFTSYVEQNGLEPEMKIEGQPDGLLITLTSDVWFASGSADINDSQREIAAQIAEMIARVQTESQVKLFVIVSGHTDDVPISGSRFPNNWWLSITRAVNFMEELMNTSTLSPSNFSARGFGEYEPIDTNDTEAGRQRNRRVEVLITPEVGGDIETQAPTDTDESLDTLAPLPSP